MANFQFLLLIRYSQKQSFATTATTPAKQPKRNTLRLERGSATFSPAAETFL